MSAMYHDLIIKAYTAFNKRDIPSALSTLHEEVEWPRAFVGGYVRGHDAITSYWSKQWTEINPTVDPVALTERQDGSIEVTVHQVVKDLQGSTLFDGTVKHVYTIEDGLLKRMDIETV